jgi:DNA-binding MarR family transcriptional regulator
MYIGKPRPFPLKFQLHNLPGYLGSHGSGFFLSVPVRAYSETFQLAGGPFKLVIEDQTPKNASLEAIKSLNEQLSDPSFKSSTRILILILLAMNRKLSASELRSFVGIGKGSLENYLAKMEASGLIWIRSVRSWGGTHQVAEITEKGLRDCRSLLKKNS